jgi:hypothetical protein
MVNAIFDVPLKIRDKRLMSPNKVSDKWGHFSRVIQLLHSKHIRAQIM